jgi:DNA-binding transcriptional ArsR family regulator
VAPQFPKSSGEDWNGFEGLDKMLEHRARLGICVLLARHQELSFSRLKELLGETDGNLGAHLRKLEESGYARVRKQFVQRKPVSWYSLSAEGRKALQSHLHAITDLIRKSKPTR